MEELLETPILLRRDERSIREAPLQLVELGLVQEVDLVEGQHDRLLCELEVFQHRPHRVDLTVRVTARVDEVQQQVGIAYLFQGRAERLDELMREFAHETHRVRQENLAVPLKLEAPSRRIERRE